MSIPLLVGIALLIIIFLVMLKLLRFALIVALILVVALLALAVGKVVINKIGNQGTAIEGNFKDCKEYCETLPHVMCVGHWVVSGTYPDCNCKYVCSTNPNLDKG